MRKTQIFSWLIILFFLTFSAHTADAQQSEKEENKEALIQWLNNLYEQGVKMENDSLIINEESLKVLNEEGYRKIMYPDVYDWGQAMQFVQTQELNKAFWYFINLYMVNEKNKDLVLKCLAAYDDLFLVDKMLVSTFYTYCYMDPEVGQIIDGMTDITAPDVLENKLRTVKELLYRLDTYRESK